MELQATDWNVVVVGAWNTAILTPDGIRKRLFELPEGTPVDIEVAVDRPGYFRVRHGGTLVTPSPTILDVMGGLGDYDSLSKACAVAKKALFNLPETPVAAAGINIRYRIDQLPDELIDLIKVSLDDDLSDRGYLIVGRTTKRTLALTPGVVNIEIAQGPDIEGVITINFHLDSTDTATLAAWIDRVEEFFNMSSKLLALLKLGDT